jgi:hypothetical protein
MPINRTILTMGLLLLSAAAAAAVGETGLTVQRFVTGVRGELIAWRIQSAKNGTRSLAWEGRSLPSAAAARPAVAEDAGEMRRDLESLPPLPDDDGIRAAACRILYSHPMLEGYEAGGRPAIQVAVRNGELALDGVVGSESDRHLAGTLARGVPGVRSVSNGLAVSVEIAQ